MSDGRSLIGRLRLSEWSLRALLILLVVDVFIVAPIAQGETLPALQPVIHSIVLLSGIAIAFRSRAPTMIVVGMLAVVSFVTHWTYHDHPTVPLGRADTALSLVFCGLITGVMLVQVFRAGPITLYRIEGAVTAYLLVAYSWALAYQLVALSDPMAFSFPATPLHPQNLRFRLLYFSTTTLTSSSYGDIIPLNPVARSLAALEGVIGQLFLALLLARLVSMELHYRTNAGTELEPDVEAKSDVRDERTQILRVLQETNWIRRYPAPRPSPSTSRSSTTRSGGTLFSATSAPLPSNANSRRT